MSDEIDDEPYGTYAPRRPKRVLHSQVVEFKMTDESVESVAERYARIKREADETTRRQLEAFERRLIAALNERRRAEAKAVTSRPWWVRLRDWWRGTNVR